MADQGLADTIAPRLRNGKLKIAGLTFYSEVRKCGRKCKACPHGPYIYAKSQTGHRLYIGKGKRTPR